MNNIPNDGRYIDTDDEPPFFSFHVRRPRLVDVLALIGISIGCAAFFQSYISGNYGMMAEREIREELSLLQGQDAALLSRVRDQENLNLRLSDGYLDLDLLEERARTLLGYVHSEDTLIKE